ncbi:hypothetical protein ACHHV8_35595 [Paenibacillus sp. TAB 01]|uniref:hypothetical protein n=1 Tax=Paenibacillus sp. TAB 01 TaxID=3368988 RepID=UPI00375358E9
MGMGSQSPAPRSHETPEAVRRQPRFAAYGHVWEHYADELALLDLLLQRIFVLRQEITPDPQTDAYRGMFISEDEFLRLVGAAQRAETGDGRLEAVEQEIEAQEAQLAARVSASRESGVFLPLIYVSAVFGLTELERRIVMTAAAVELDRKYERIFGFLQDDLTAKLPNVSLVLQLVCRTPEEHRAARMSFALTGKLARYFCTGEMQETAGRSMLSGAVALDRRMAMFLLDSGAFDEGLKPAASIYYPDEALPPLRVGEDAQLRLQSYLRQAAARSKEPEARETRRGIYLWGKPGAGKRLQVRHACSAMGKPVLMADASLLSSLAAADFVKRMQELIREAMLHQAALAFTGVTSLYPEEQDAAAKQRAEQFYGLLEVFEGWLFLLGERPLRLNGEAPDRMWLEAELGVPEERQREALWEAFAAELNVKSDADWRAMGGKFRFTPGQIRRSLLLAAELTGWDTATAQPDASADGGEIRIRTETLIQACYGQVQHKLERKATRIVPRYGWDDIVLPDEQKDQLRSACNQVKYRTLVYGSWGFDRKLAYGKGLSMLFAGSSRNGENDVRPGGGQGSAAGAVQNRSVAGHQQIYRGNGKKPA